MASARTADAISKPREKSTDTVYLALRDKILSNALRPGTQMLEQELVQLFGVSRTPVREALIRLQNEHLVQIIPRHGVRVRNVSMADIEEVFQVQTSLEATAAATVAARKPGARELKVLEKACTDMDRAFAKHDREAWSAAREAFYARLVEMSDNPRLTQIVGECSDQVRRVRELTLRLIDPDESQARDLHAIVEALRQGDASSAQALCRENRARNLQTQIDALRRFRILDV
ncbi:GntR family transcriptional regulator [Caballeronia novacaledonica]|uniref:GntR family transcriptional regulator n=1 Tax=Caballeronia novacaledonica TaxID=1544861 RepID=A0A2U3I0L6_9BURK|nr:GntR family transcriptional regulator [Caballeronia novacaledonica]SPB13614.1 GntR family transcriptional regulator [Caballeronia novacaledonica]